MSKLTIRNPKNGRTTEVVFIPKRLADRLKDYLKTRDAEGDQRIFPISYTAARAMVRKAGALVGGCISDLITSDAIRPRMPPVPVSLLKLSIR